MDNLNFSENLVKLRHEKKITQEQVADFIGITKASVSKWETKQSMPDILLLPELAAFFNVTIDQLLGYEPQLSKEQIQRIYQELSADFTQRPFAETIAKSRELVKKYYSCYPLLFQISVLWLNHFMLAEKKEWQKEILQDICNLFDRILCGCKDRNLCSDAAILQAAAQLQLGKLPEAVETLEQSLDPYRLSTQSDVLLVQAYQMTGQTRRAISFSQISMFTHLLSLIAGATQYLALCQEDLPLCEETLQRIEPILSAYNFEQIHPNTAALFLYQTATVYCSHGKPEKALPMLKRYASCISILLEAENPVFCGDAYFNFVQSWYEGSDLGFHAPRNKKTIFDSAMQSFQNPALESLRENPEYKALQSVLKEKGENL